MTWKTLKRGEKGSATVKLQHLLNRVGAMLICDGDYGRGTERGVCYAQDMAGLTVSGECDETLWNWLSEQNEPFPELATEGVAMIAREETGGLAYYDMVCWHPHYPGYASGITIGVGYDLRFNSRESFRNLWFDLLPTPAFNELAKDLGHKGTKARETELKNMGIEVPFKAAWQVFVDQLLPEYYEKTAQAFPQLPLLPKLCRAVLVSLVFNRGSSFSGGRRLEMRNIRDRLQQAFSAAGSEPEKQAILLGVEEDILDMRRLWGSESGLYKRRQVEANLWRQGLQS